MLNKKVFLSLFVLLILAFIFSAIPLNMGYLIYIGLFQLGEFFWPAALSVSERIFLTVMWLAGLLFIVALAISAVRFKARQYVYAILTALCVFSVITLTRIPLSAEQHQRWLAKTLIAQRDWTDLQQQQTTEIRNLLYAVAFGHESEREIAQRYQNVLARFKSAPTFPELEPQSLELTPIWQSLLDNKSVSSPKDMAYLDTASKSLLQDAPLAFAVGLLKLRHPKEYSAESPVDIFYQAIVAKPDDPTYWEALALAYSLNRGGVDGSESDLKNAYAALAFADYLKLNRNLKLNNNPSSLTPTHSLLQNEIETLTVDERENYLRLQAKGQVKSHQLLNLEVDARVIELAGSPLFVSKLTPTVENGHTFYGGEDTNYPGKLVINAEGTTILPESIEQLNYPRVSYKVDKAQVTVAADVNEKGLPIFALVDKTSKITAYDKLAETVVSKLRFSPTGQTERHIVTIDFLSTVKSLKEYSDLVAPRAMLVSRALARKNTQSIESSLSNLTHYISRSVPAKFGRGSQPYYQEFQSRNEVAKEIQQALRQPQERSLSNGAAWQISTDNIRAILARHPHSIEALGTTARVELMHYNAARNLLTENKKSAMADGFIDDDNKWQELLLSARSHYMQIITINPDRMDAWFGWGVTMIDEDPELAAGAFAVMYYLQKDDINYRLYMAQARFFLFGLPDTTRERVSIMNARMAQRYIKNTVDTEQPLSEQDKQQQEESRITAQKVMPSVVPFAMNIRPVPQFTANSTEHNTASVDTLKYGIQSDLLLPPLSDKLQGEAILQIDVPNNGIPSMVSLYRSSGNSDFDDDLMLAAYHWRFNKSSRNKIILVPVTLGDAKPIAITP